LTCCCNDPTTAQYRSAVSSVKVAPSRLCKNKSNNYLVASAGADGLCKIWDLQNPITSRTAGAGGARRAVQNCSICVGHSRGINDVAWNSVAPLLATASDDKTCRIWDAVTAETLVELKGHDNFVFCVDQYHNMVATGSFDESVKLWDIRTGDCFTTLPAHSDPVTAVSFNRDGTTLCTASHDGLIRIWDVATAECLKTIFAAGNPSVSSVKYSANAKYILAGTLDSTLRLWPVALNGTNTCAKTYRDKLYQNTKYSVVADFTCTGDILVGNETGQCLLFDVQTGRVKQVLAEAHEDAVLAVSAHDTLPFLCTGGMTNDRKVEFWSTDGIEPNPMHNRSLSSSNAKKQQVQRRLQQQQRLRENNNNNDNTTTGMV
jgi:COMPASS component SWD3